MFGRALYLVKTLIYRKGFKATLVGIEGIGAYITYKQIRKQ